jgi:hypothetical protein
MSGSDASAQSGESAAPARRRVRVRKDGGY